MKRRSARNTLGWVVASTLRLTGGVRRAHEKATQSNCVLGLCFHNPPRNLFEAVIKWFQKRGYRFLSVNELESCLKAGIPFPKGSAWISFDDAWKGNLTEVVPIIRDRNLPATIFVSTEETRRGTFWFTHALRNAHALPEPFRTDVQQLWRVPDPLRRRVMDDLFERIAPETREAMSIAEIAELAKLPQVTIGSHSENHAIMPNCDDEELRNELRNSKRDLEEWTGRPVRVFAYPNGDFDERTSRVLAEEGYSLAFTIQNRAITLAANHYYVPRFSIMDDGSLSENICHAFGLWAPVITAIKRVKQPNLHRPVSMASEWLR